jgi:hypothetical protein
VPQWITQEKWGPGKDWEDKTAAYSEGLYREQEAWKEEPRWRPGLLGDLFSLTELGQSSTQQGDMRTTKE